MISTKVLSQLTSEVKLIELTSKFKTSHLNCYRNLGGGGEKNMLKETEEL